jgi:hypothetical protein
MKITTRLCAACAGVTALAMGIGLAWGESGSSAGQVNANNGVLEVRVKTGEAKKSSTKIMRFQYGVDTEVTLGDEKIRGAEIPAKWNVKVTWKQDVETPKEFKPGALPGKKGEPPVTSKTVFVAPVNKNPMVAERIEVVTKSETMVFAGFDGNDKVKVTVEEPGTPAVGKTKAKGPRHRTVMANLYDKAKFFVDNEEVDRSTLKDREGQEVKADVIDDGGVRKCRIRNAAAQRP